MTRNKMFIKIAYDKGYRIECNKVYSAVSKRYLQPTLCTRGYYKFSVYHKEHGASNVWMHTLLAYQKFGDTFMQNGIMARHLDGNKLNNTYDNIGMGTNSDNQMDIPENARKQRGAEGRQKGATITRKFTDVEMETIRDEHACGSSYKDLMKR